MKKIVVGSIITIFLVTAVIGCIYTYDLFKSIAEIAVYENVVTVPTPTPTPTAIQDNQMVKDVNEKSNINDIAHENTQENQQISNGNKDSEENPKTHQGVLPKDKDKASKLVFGRLSASDIAMLSGLLKDGLTAEEKKAAVELAYKRFNSSEIEFIKEMYRKYSNLIK